MPPPTLAHKETLKLRLRQQYGMEKMPFYIEQAQKQFTEPNPPDWIFLYKYVDRSDILFIRCHLWQAGTSPGLVYGCDSFSSNFEKDWEMTARDTIIAETFHGSLSREDSDLLIQMAQQPCRENLKIYLTYLKNSFKFMFNGGYSHSSVQAAILRRQPPRTTYNRNVGAFLFLNHKLVSAIRDALRKIVDCERAEITVGDVI